jgi:membrane protein
MVRWLEVALRAGTAYGRDRCAIYAAGVTYYALVSLFPLTLFIVSILGFVVDVDQQQRLVDELMTTLPLTEEGGREDLEDVIDSVIAARGALGVIGLVGTAYSASALFGSVRLALNGVFHVERQRPFLLGKAIDLGLVAGFGLLLFLSFVLTFAIAFVQRQAADLFGEDLATLTRLLANLGYLLVPPLVTSLVFTLLYTRVARVGFTWRVVLPGVLVAAFLFEALKIGFAQYVTSFSDFDATYGALGFVIILLLFFNLSAQVMLVGAEVARANVEVRGLERHGEPMETVLRVRHAVAGSLERAHRWPVVGRAIPRDRAGELIEVLRPDELEEELVAFAPARSPEAPPARPVDEAEAAVSWDASAEPRSGSFARWAVATGVALAVVAFVRSGER